MGQYLEFVQAYAPYYEGNPNAYELTGFWIGTQGGGIYTAPPETLNFPAVVSWQMAARYCNWLTNDKASNAISFAAGAYDTTTFTRNADGTWNDQTTRSPGAKFWIPSLDEWSKAVYYDPNRYGPGQEGYWTQPNGTNIPLLSGFPQDGGQTSAGISDSEPEHTVPVGAYSDVQSPWGLFDASGGISEYTEEWPTRHTYRVRKGSWQGMEFWDTADSLDGWGAQFPTAVSATGLRIASIPAPASCLCGILAVAVFVPRRRIA